MTSPQQAMRIKTGCITVKVFLVEKPAWSSHINLVQSKILSVSTILKLLSSAKLSNRLSIEGLKKEAIRKKFSRETNLLFTLQSFME